MNTARTHARKHNTTTLIIIIWQCVVAWGIQNNEKCSAFDGLEGPKNERKKIKIISKETKLQQQQENKQKFFFLLFLFILIFFSKASAMLKECDDDDGSV